MFFIFGLRRLANFPKFLLIICHFVCAFLLCFLLLSCIKPSATYSNAYLVKFCYNSKNNVSAEVSGLSRSVNGSSSSPYFLTAGYTSVCVSDRNSLTCMKNTNFGGIAYSTSIVLDDGAAAVDPVALALLFSRHIVKPYFVAIALGLTVCALVATMWHTLKFMPLRPFLHKAENICSILNFVFLSVGAVWQQVACYAVTNTVNNTSLSILTASTGKSATAMCFSALSLSCMSSIISLTVYRREVVLPAKMIENGMV